MTGSLSVPTHKASVWAALRNATVIIAALGYFVDIYDLVLFSIVRVASLKDLGVPESQLLKVGVDVFNMQMGGMLVGGVIWGVLGDRRGRVSTLFGSILLYSLANIANAFVTTTAAYGWWRFVAGVGLAGELGAAITLVSEVLPKETRAYGTSFVAGIGVSGAMLAAVIGQEFSWRTAFTIGGVMGLMLLVLRLKLYESGMFKDLRAKSLSGDDQQVVVKRGDLRLLLGSPERALRYLRCILIGMPTWFVVGIVITFSPEICRELGATGPVSAGTGILFNYGGLVLGDLASGFISQWAHSRKKVMFGFVALTFVTSIIYLNSPSGMSPTYYYSLAFLLGCFGGFWALFVTIAAEQFGTNLRATVATTTPNFVRGSVLLLTFAFQGLKDSLGLATSALYVGIGCFALTFIALWKMHETYGRDLAFLEMD